MKLLILGNKELANMWHIIVLTSAWQRNCKSTTYFEEEAQSTCLLVILGQSLKRRNIFDANRSAYHDYFWRASTQRRKHVAQTLTSCWLRSGGSLSYREFIECWYIGLFRISKSISYRTSHIEYLNILKTNDFFVFFRRKFQKISENSENSPKIQKTHEPKSSTTTTAPKIPKICRKFLKKKVFFEALITYHIISYQEKKLHIVSISY